MSRACATCISSHIMLACVLVHTILASSIETHNICVCVDLLCAREPPNETIYSLCARRDATIIYWHNACANTYQSRFIMQAWYCVCMFSLHLVDRWGDLCPPSASPTSLRSEIINSSRLVLVRATLSSGRASRTLEMFSQRTYEHTVHATVRRQCQCRRRRFARPWGMGHRRCAMIMDICCLKRVGLCTAFEPRSLNATRSAARACVFIFIIYISFV